MTTGGFYNNDVTDHIFTIEIAGAYGSPDPDNIPPPDDGKEKIRNSNGSEYTKVGRWMSAEEYKLMEKTGRVQEGAGGQTFVANGGWRSFYKEAKVGSVYAELEVPISSLLRGGRSD